MIFYYQIKWIDEDQQNEQVHYYQRNYRNNININNNNNNNNNNYNNNNSNKKNFKNRHFLGNKDWQQYLTISKNL